MALSLSSCWRKVLVVASASRQEVRDISISRLSPAGGRPLHRAATPAPRGRKSLRRIVRVTGSLQMGQLVFWTARMEPVQPGQGVSARTAGHLCPERHSLKEHGAGTGGGSVSMWKGSGPSEGGSRVSEVPRVGLRGMEPTTGPLGPKASKLPRRGI